MMIMFIICAVISFFVAYAAIFDSYDDHPILGTLIFIVGIFFCYQAYIETTPEQKAIRAAEDAQKIADDQAKKVREETPHVVREADGCKVYAFKSGDHWHFFTRCPDSTTVTDTGRTECTGTAKARSCKTVYSSIETTK